MEQAGLSQRQMARMFHMYRLTISEFEAGHRKVSTGGVGIFADIYDISAVWLLCRDRKSDEGNGRVQLAARVGRGDQGGARRSTPCLSIFGGNVLAGQKSGSATRHGLTVGSDTAYVCA